jgi:hypothetical protein
VLRGFIRMWNANSSLVGRIAAPHQDPQQKNYAEPPSETIRKASSASQTPDHLPAHSNVNERFARGSLAVVVFAHSPVLREARKRSAPPPTAEADLRTYAALRHRVPNLEEKDEQQAHRFLTDVYCRHIPQEEYNVRHPEDYVMEMPQSGERFWSWENMRAFQEAHPAVVSAGAPSAGQGGAVGYRGGHRLQRRAGIRRGGNQRA